MKFQLIYDLTKREVLGRYRGSILGIFWSMLTPLFMLGVYTFVFGSVFKARWSIPGRQGSDHSMVEFAIILFAGLIVFQIFSEVVSRAPSLILSNANFVKKVVFPLEVLPVVATGAALFHGVISLAILLVFQIVFMNAVPWTIILVPVVLLPLIILILGLGWFFASFGTYLRDINQILVPIVSSMMFLSPIFFERKALPVGVQNWIVFNPITIPAEQLREVMIFGILPDWTAYFCYLVVALLVAFAGFRFFNMTRRGFADVI